MSPKERLWTLFLFCYTFPYMKNHLSHFASKISFWNLFIGIVIGFGAGVILINALVPDADQLIKIYRLDQKSVTEDKQAQKAGSVEGFLQIEGK